MLKLPLPFDLNVEDLWRSDLNPKRVWGWIVAKLTYHARKGNKMVACPKAGRQNPLPFNFKLSIRMMNIFFLVHSRRPFNHATAPINGSRIQLPWTQAMFYVLCHFEYIASLQPQTYLIIVSSFVFNLST